MVGNVETQDLASLHYPPFISLSVYLRRLPDGARIHAFAGSPVHRNMRFLHWECPCDADRFRRTEKQLDALCAGKLILERKAAVVFGEFVLGTAVMRPEKRTEIGEAALFDLVLAEMREQCRQLDPFENEKLVAHKVN